MNDARQHIQATGTCRTCGGELILCDSTWDTKGKRWKGGGWLHLELPSEIHVPWRNSEKTQESSGISS